MSLASRAVLPLLLLLTALAGCATRSPAAKVPIADRPLDDPAFATAGVSATDGPAETIAVLASGAVVHSQTKLATGELYLLRATGTVTGDGTAIDAEYAGAANQAADRQGSVDVGVDVGRLQFHPAAGRKAKPDGPDRMKWFGPARADHTYHMIVTGQDTPLALKFTGPIGGAGRIDVALFPLSPPPPAVGPALDLVSVPVAKVNTATQLITQAGAVYLLQAAGTGKVGGGGLGLGDAEYMDWAADGTGKNEGEASSDFGLGVDEDRDRVKDVGRGSAYEPRLRWWGRFRPDHVYYMLFLGTGKPIALAYHDSGYGDNSKTDALTLKVFAAP